MDLRSSFWLYWTLAVAAAYQYEPPNLQYQAYMPPPAAKKTTLQQPVQPEVPTEPPTEPPAPQTAPPVLSGGYLPPTGVQDYKPLPESQPLTDSYLPPTNAPTKAASVPEAPTTPKVAATLSPAPEVVYQAPSSAEPTAPPQGYMGVPESQTVAVGPPTLALVPQPDGRLTLPHVEAEGESPKTPEQPGAPAGPGPAGYGLPSMVNYGSIKNIVDKAGKLPEGAGYGYGFPPSPRTSTSTTTTTLPTTTTTPEPTTTVTPTTPELVTTPPAPPPTPCSSSTQQGGTTPCPLSGVTTPCPNSGKTTTQEPSTKKPCPSSQTGARQMVIRQPEEHQAGEKKVLAKEVLCHDLFDKCTEWAADGECELNPFWMRPHCQRSCHSCGVTVADIDKPNVHGHPTECQNHHELCQYWKRGGECESNIDYMTIHCPLSCGFC